jgi:hypothetical protein
VREFLCCGRLERRDARALRVDTAEDVRNGAVLARCVGALEDEQQGALVLRPQPRLQFDERLAVVGERRVRGFAATLQRTRVTGIERRYVDLRPGFDLPQLSHRCCTLAHRPAARLRRDASVTRR